MALSVSVAPRAVRAINDAISWWARNRDKAPNALAEDLEQALELISRHPALGTRVRNSRLAGVRRLRLSRVRYHLYYRVLDSSPPTVEVLAFWHASRFVRTIRESRVAVPAPLQSQAQ